MEAIKILILIWVVAAALIALIYLIIRKPEPELPTRTDDLPKKDPPKDPPEKNPPVQFIYRTENEEYATIHNLWICSYCETLNEGGKPVEFSRLRGKVIMRSSANKCICCGKSGVKIFEKRGVDYVL